jgi:hypothetical protein
MKSLVLLAVTALLALCGCGESKTTEPTATNASSNPLTAPVDYLGAVGKAQQQAVKTVDTAAIQQAIQLFQVEHGRNPKDLNELVQEKFLPRIPEAPYGMKIVYDPATAKVRVIQQ